MTGIAEAFNTLRRFHVYDHDQDDWWVSGVDFGDRALIRFPDEPETESEWKAMSSAEMLVQGEEDLQLVWEDGPDSDTENVAIDLEVAGKAADLIIEELSHDLDVDEDRVRVASLEAPNEVYYFLLDDFEVMEE